MHWPARPTGNVASSPLFAVQQRRGRRTSNSVREAAAIAQALGRSLDELMKVAESATFKPRRCSKAMNMCGTTAFAAA
jgi:hypothetical protein